MVRRQAKPEFLLRWTAVHSKVLIMNCFMDGKNPYNRMKREKGKVWPYFCFKTSGKKCWQNVSSSSLWWNYKSDFSILFYAAQFPTRAVQILFDSGGREVCSHTWR